MAEHHQIVYVCCLWPWLGRPLAAVLFYVLPVLRMTSCFHNIDPTAACRFHSSNIASSDYRSNVTAARAQPNTAVNTIMTSHMGMMRHVTSGVARGGAGGQVPPQSKG